MNFCDSSSVVTGHIRAESYHQEIPVLRLLGKAVVSPADGLLRQIGSKAELLAKKSQAGDIWHGKEIIVASQIHYTHTLFFLVRAGSLKRKAYGAYCEMEAKHTSIQPTTEQFHRSWSHVVAIGRKRQDL